jgi:hypothetical protein
VTDNASQEKHNRFHSYPVGDEIEPYCDSLQELHAAVYLIGGRRSRAAEK